MLRTDVCKERESPAELLPTTFCHDSCGSMNGVETAVDDRVGAGADMSSSVDSWSEESVQQWWCRRAAGSILSATLLMLPRRLHCASFSDFDVNRAWRRMQIERRSEEKYRKRSTGGRSSETKDKLELAHEVGKSEGMSVVVPHLRPFSRGFYSFVLRGTMVFEQEKRPDGSAGQLCQSCGMGGGQGSVDVVIKIFRLCSPKMSQTLEEQEIQKQMFQKELCLLSFLRNVQGVTAVQGWGSLVGGVPFLVLHHGGPSLEECSVVRSGMGLDTSQGMVDCIGVLTDVLCTLRESVGLGIVHGDIRPSNILVGVGGGLLCDWGSAFLLSNDRKEWGGGKTTQRGSWMRDLVGLGQVLLMLCLGRPSFPSRLFIQACEELKGLDGEDLSVGQRLHTAAVALLFPESVADPWAIEGVYAAAEQPLRAAHGLLFLQLP